MQNVDFSAGRRFLSGFAVKSGFSVSGISVWVFGENLCVDNGSIGGNCIYRKPLHFVDTNFKYRKLRLSANHSFKSTKEQLDELPKFMIRSGEGACHLDVSLGFK